MFTGIVEEAGTVERIKPTARSIEMTVRANVCGRGLKIGGSVAINGCCLTAVKISPRGKSRLIQFDLLQESWKRTNFQFAKPGSLVNLERSLRANGELGGHFVTGHVDGLGKIIRWEKSGADHVIDIAAPPDVMRYVVFKGSIAVDGISLTVAGLGADRFDVQVVPYTMDHTNLRRVQIRDRVNIECDMIGKYVVRAAELAGLTLTRALPGETTH
jgi:riboflavin synthase